MLEKRDFDVDYCGLRLSFERFESFCDGAPVALTISEFKILSTLLREAGRVASRKRLLQEVAPNHTIIERNIDVHVQAIRKKLGPKGQSIQTVRGLGYKWDTSPEQPYFRALGT